CWPPTVSPTSPTPPRSLASSARRFRKGCLARASRRGPSPSPNRLGRLSLEGGLDMGDLVRLDVEEGVATIRLDRPPMNAINEELVGDLSAVATEVNGRDDVRAAVIWGG